MLVSATRKRTAGARATKKAPRRPNVKLDHVSLPVKRLAAARKFYEATLGALGMTINMDVGDAFGMGSNSQKIFWIVQHARASGGAHHAFSVASRLDVERFHAAGLRAGGTDHGRPGPRPNYGPNYYAAFVKDPEGNNIEAVCYKRAPRRKT
ncbi:MAG TPA: VOC family protein [Polyangiaceae bacterium]